MRKKWNGLALCSFLIALAIFGFTYLLFHHLDADGSFFCEYHVTPVKPFVTLLFGIWGVMFLFTSVMSALIGAIFYPRNKADQNTSEDDISGEKS